MIRCEILAGSQACQCNDTDWLVNWIFVSCVRSMVLILWHHELMSLSKILLVSSAISHFKILRTPVSRLWADINGAI